MERDMNLQPQQWLVAAQNNGDMASVRWNIASSSNGTITVVLRGGSVRLYGC
jgi:hypothetical protein